MPKRVAPEPEPEVIIKKDANPKIQEIREPYIESTPLVDVVPKESVSDVVMPNDKVSFAENSKEAETQSMIKTSSPVSDFDDSKSNSQSITSVENIDNDLQNEELETFESQNIPISQPLYMNYINNNSESIPIANLVINQENLLELD